MASHQEDLQIIMLLKYQSELVV